MVKVDNKIIKDEDDSSVGEIESDPWNKTRKSEGIRKSEQSEVVSDINWYSAHQTSRIIRRKKENVLELGMRDKKVICPFFRANEKGI